MRFRWDGKEFESSDAPTFAELDLGERLTGRPMDEWTPMTATRVALFMAVRRADPELLSWEASGELSPDDVDILDDAADQEADADPPAPPSSPRGRRAAGGRSKTAAARTSSS